MNLTSYIWLPILIPLFVGISEYKYLNKELRYLFYFVIYGTFTELVYFISVKIGVTNTLLNNNIYTVIAFFLLGIFYQKILDPIVPNKVSKIIIALFVVLSSIYIVVNGIFQFAAYPRSIFNIVFIVASIAFFYKTMVEEKVKNLWDEPLVWINMAVLIYYSGSLFFSLLFNLILEYSKELSSFTVISFAVMGALFYVFITVGFLKAGKQYKRAE